MQQRCLQGELMDDPSLADDRHRRALTGLARLNRLSFASRILFDEIVDLLPRRGGPLRVLDVATGGGDVPVALARMAARKGYPLHIEGCDVSPTALDHARRAADRAGVDLTLHRCDAVREPLPTAFDVVTCSLFLHHLTDAQALESLTSMKQAARRRVLVLDLNRTRLNLWLVRIAARLVTRSPIVHTDADRSVRAAFTVKEIQRLAQQAGLAGASVQSRNPSRWLLRWDRREGATSAFR